MVVEKLVKLTYNKIFFEDLHILQSDIDSIKNLVLNNHKLLTKKLDRVFFISGLTEKIKYEKINECLKQERQYGEVLMQNYKEIFTLYNWLVNSNFENSRKLNIKEVFLYKWEKEDEKILFLFEKLKNNFINSNTSFDVFKFLFSGKKLKSLNKKIEWLKVSRNGITNKKSITDFIEILLDEKVISKPTSISKSSQIKILDSLFSSKDGNLKFTTSNFVTPTKGSQYRNDLEIIIKSIL